MSRFLIALMVLFAAAAPAIAQERIAIPIVQPAPQVTAEEVIDAAKSAYGPPDARPKPKCPAPKAGDEIVVCAEQQEQSQFRTQGSEINGDKGAPRAPNMESDFGHTGVGVVFKGCFIPPCPPPMAKIIDLKAIPEAPPGSDADRAARGLAPSRDGAGRALPMPADAPAPAALPAAQAGESRGTAAELPAVTSPGSASPGGGP